MGALATCARLAVRTNGSLVPSAWFLHLLFSALESRQAFLGFAHHERRRCFGLHLAENSMSHFDSAAVQQTFRPRKTQKSSGSSWPCWSFPSSLRLRRESIPQL